MCPLGAWHSAETVGHRGLTLGGCGRALGIPILVWLCSPEPLSLTLQTGECWCEEDSTAALRQLVQVALAFCGLMPWAWLCPQGRKVREGAAIGCCGQGCAVQYSFSLQGESVLAPLCTSSETSLSFPGSFPKWVKKNLKWGFMKSCHLCPLQIPTWHLMLPEPSELPAGGCSCLGRAQLLGRGSCC